MFTKINTKNNMHLCQKDTECMSKKYPTICLKIFEGALGVGAKKKT